MSAKCYPLIEEFAVTSPYNIDGKKTYEGYSVRVHKGIDLDVTKDHTNVQIVSVTDGVVKRAQWQSGYGNYVWVANNDGTACIYAHMEKILVSVGQSVSPKSLLGYMGNTGHSTGKHLHFGVATNQDYSTVHSKNLWFNPAFYLGMQDYYNLKGRTFSGSGYVDGRSVGQTSANSSESSTNATASTSYSTTTSSSSSISSSIVPSGEFYEIKDLKGVTSDWLYGRRYRCIVDLGDGQAFDVSELRCEFEIVKSAYYEANQSILSIYNLSPDDENKLIKAGQKIIIEAGYNGDQYGIIFAGNIIQPLRSKENGVDYKLTLVSMDSDRYVAYGLVGVSLVANQSMRQAVDACTTKAGQITGSNYGMQTGVISDQRINYPRGKVMFGSPTTYLNQIAKSVNATYYNEDGMVNIISPKELADNEIFDLSPDSGLINYPVQSEYGITCTCLLNPRMKVNSLFHLDNTKIAGNKYQTGQVIRPLDSSGIYRVIKLTHKGDTRGDSWETQVEAISQAGMLPGMAVGDAAYIY